jgi:hypothetical protein
LGYFTEGSVNFCSTFFAVHLRVNHNFVCLLEYVIVSKDNVVADVQVYEEILKNIFATSTPVDISLVNVTFTQNDNHTEVKFEMDGALKIEQNSVKTFENTIATTDGVKDYFDYEPPKGKFFLFFLSTQTMSKY